MYSFNYLHEKIDNCVLILRFLIVGLKRSFWAGQTRKDSEKLSDDEKSKEFTIIRTWLGEKSFGSNGVFNDPYFMNLSDYLKKEGESVIVLPILYSLKRSYKEALLWLRQSNTQFIIPEDHYHFSDYLAALLTAFRANSFARESFSFAALDLSLLFRDELIRSQFELGLLQITMHFSLMKRLKEKGIKIKKVIFTFENMVHEKPLLLGAAKYYPQASTIGFQHSVLYPLLLSFFVSSKEINSLPIPKKIVCSGKFFKEKLQEEGYPASRLFEGPALRFQYLLKEQAWRNKNSDGALITLPLIKTSSLELLIKSWQALKDFPQIKVLIKAHPMMPKQEIDEIISAAGIKKENLALIDCSMQEALAQAGFVIAMASGTIFDALAFGLPVIRVRQDMDLNLDPLDWFASDQFQFVGRTADEIKENINKIVALSDSQRSAIKQKGQELIERCFSPINDQTLTSLLN